MKEFPPVAVVIPAYNEEKYIANTLHALCAQRYQGRITIIVVNNASTDRTGAVVLHFMSAERFPPNITMQLINEPMPGILHARSAGYHAAGDAVYVAQVDADCLPGVDWVELAVLYLDHRTQRVAVSGPYEYYDASLIVHAITLVTQRIVFQFFSFMVQAVGRGALLIGGNTMIRKTALDAVGGYNIALNFYSEDTDTACRLATQGKVLFVPSLLMKTSARRFKGQGFISVSAKYFKVFFMLMLGMNISEAQSHEAKHPR